MQAKAWSSTGRTSVIADNFGQEILRLHPLKWLRDLYYKSDNCIFTDHRFLCELANPPLSSVAHSLQEIGYRACTVLDEIMNGGVVPNKPILIEPQGVIARQSSDIFAIDDPLIAKAIQYIRDHACDGINVNDVLKRIPLTRATLTRRFEKYIGHSAKEEIMRLQMIRVKQLLTETDFKLDKIAKLSGYNHVEHMSTIFKTKYAITPGKYRERSRNESRS